MILGEIQKENEQEDKERAEKKNEDNGGQREWGAKEQLQIKQGYYPEGSIMMCFCVLFCKLVCLTHIHSNEHTPQRQQCL